MFSRREYGGKGNLGMFIEREPRICAAGKPTAQPEENIKNNLSKYLLQDEVDGLMGDAIHPSTRDNKLPPLKGVKVKDMRNAGIFGEGANLINPPQKTKFQSLIEDFKSTTYNSYWKREVGKMSDPVPLLPPGLPILRTTMGKKIVNDTTLYDIIMPTEAIPDNTPKWKQPGYQTNRNYLSFDRNATFGQKSNLDTSGKLVKCCLTDERRELGTALKAPISEKLCYYRDFTGAKLGIPLAPNRNIKCVPKGFSFGKLEPPDNNSLPECLRYCEINPKKELMKKCLEHLNTVRKCLLKRLDATFFSKFYLNLKYLDVNKTGKLDKKIIYDECNSNYIRLNSSLIEPLLSTWQAFDGNQIDYKTFVLIINYREPLPDLPKIQDIPEECVNFSTTYSEMVDYKHLPHDQQLRAGLPSGRYFDQAYPITPQGYCKADRIYLPEETDMKACLCPSILSSFGIYHRDMYSQRDPETVRKLFENVGEHFDDEKFQIIWEKAKERHSQGWVCFETFRQALKEYEIVNDQQTKS